MTGAPNYRLPRQKRDRASFVRALRAERMQLITRLQNQDALSAHRHNHKLVLLKLGRFIACEMCWAGRPSLRQRFKIANDWISDADQPAEKTRAQKKIEKMATRCCRTRNCCLALFHRQFSIRRENLFQVFTPSRQPRDLREQNSRASGHQRTPFRRGRCQQLQHYAHSVELFLRLLAGGFHAFLGRSCRLCIAKRRLNLGVDRKWTYFLSVRT